MRTITRIFASVGLALVALTGCSPIIRWLDNNKIPYTTRAERAEEKRQALYENQKPTNNYNSSDIEKLILP